MSETPFSAPPDPLDVIQALESAIQEIVFVGIGLVFLLTVESRLKRTRVLRFIRELRALGRYLDYCSELLSLTSKVAALYAERTDDSVVLQAVDPVEDLTTGMSQKIWQKIVILNERRDRMA